MNPVRRLSDWLDAEPTEVTARGFSYVQPGIEDVVFMTMGFPGGVGGVVRVGTRRAQSRG